MALTGGISEIIPRIYMILYESPLLRKVLLDIKDVNDRHYIGQIICKSDKSFI